MSLKEGEYLTSTLPKHWPSDFPLPRSVLQPRSREHALFLGILPHSFFLTFLIFTRILLYFLLGCIRVCLFSVLGPLVIPQVVVEYELSTSLGAQSRHCRYKRHIPGLKEPVVW